MNIKTAVVLVGVGLLLGGRPVVAHHAFSAEFDAAKPVKLTGAVTQINWTNPHAWIYIDAKDETGKVGNWGFELASPNGLMRQGWKRTTLKAGDMVTIEGLLAKNGSNNASVRTVIVISTGEKLFSGSNQGQQP